MATVAAPAGSQTDARSWRLTVPLEMRNWNGDYVVFCPLSGNTHMLDVVAGELIGRLAVGAVSENELRSHLAGFLEVPEDAALATEIARILGQLDELGLVEPAG